MKQHKMQFTFDYFIEITDKKKLYKASKWLCLIGVPFAMDPWEDGRFRVYVRKEAIDVLKDIEEAIDYEPTK